ncbi:MAG: hypothetical protein HY397_01150 [Candidatus Doudnabacteria bacterium]|nr:hypothetical protein [Candidatus Doudnabacteria bacterium]
MLRKRILGAVVLLTFLAFVSGWFSAAASRVLAQVSKTDNPVANLLVSRFLPEPNLLAEDHVELSCEDNFSVKVFTAETLVNAKFEVRDAATNALLFQTEIPKIHPLWQKVHLGPMVPFPPPPKIKVIMTAQNKKGEAVRHELILEPDCDRSLVEHTTIIFPPPNGCKLIINPGGGGGGGQHHTGWPTVSFVVPPEHVGKKAEVVVKDLLDTIVARNSQPLLGDPDFIIPTEIVSLNLVSVQPLPPSSFFDVFFEVRIGEEAHPQTRAACTVIDGSALEQLLMEPWPDNGHGIIAH